jgi:uncharacterized membrane protein
MNSLLDLIKAHLKQPEYLHALLRVFPVEGLALGIMALIIALVQRSRSAQITALILVFFCSAMAWPAAKFGEEGYDRIEAMSQDAGYAWLDAHAQRATKTVFVFYILAGVSLVALVLPWKFPRTAVPLAAFTLLLSFGSLAVGGWIAYAGGQIRHSEFRYGRPPEKLGGYEKMRD